MNAPFPTQGAEGLPRRGFTNRDILRMIESGIIDADELFELIRGEIVPMSPEYDRHARARMRLTRLFNRALGEEWLIGSETSLFLADDIEFKPDLHIFSAGIKTEEVRGRDVAFAVELSSTTQKRDLQMKAPLYAAYGVRELWVIDLVAATGLIFTRIDNGVYAPGRAVAESDVLTPGAFPQISVRIADLR